MGDGGGEEEEEEWKKEEDEEEEEEVSEGREVGGGRVGWGEDEEGKVSGAMRYKRGGRTFAVELTLRPKEGFSYVVAGGCSRGRGHDG